jgi:uncharacterized Fe-S cluster-containing MiaB family protein
MSSLERWLKDRQEERDARQRRPRDPKTSVTTWTEEELLDGVNVKALVGILETRG